MYASLTFYIIIKTEDLCHSCRSISPNTSAHSLSFSLFSLYLWCCKKKKSVMETCHIHRHVWSVATGIEQQGESVCVNVWFTWAVAVCGGLGDWAGQRAPADLGRALVELLFLVGKLDLRERAGDQYSVWILTTHIVKFQTNIRCQALYTHMHRSCIIAHSVVIY